jgi:hypothetical protein
MTSKVYNLSKESSLKVGDHLSDPDGNKYVVVDMEYAANPHSQYANLVLVNCYHGYNKGKERWIDHWIASGYKDFKLTESANKRKGTIE